MLLVRKDSTGIVVESGQRSLHDRLLSFMPATRDNQDLQRQQTIAGLLQDLRIMTSQYQENLSGEKVCG